MPDTSVQARHPASATDPVKPSFDAARNRRAAEDISRAVVGLGTEEETIVFSLAGRSKADIAQMEKDFTTQPHPFGKSGPMKHVIDREVTGHWQHLVNNLYQGYSAQGTADALRLCSKSVLHFTSTLPLVAGLTSAQRTEVYGLCNITKEADAAEKNAHASLAGPTYRTLKLFAHDFDAGAVAGEMKACIDQMRAEPAKRTSIDADRHRSAAQALQFLAESPWTPQERASIETTFRKLNGGTGFRAELQRDPDKLFLWLGGKVTGTTDNAYGDVLGRSLADSDHWGHDRLARVIRAADAFQESYSEQRAAPVLPPRIQ